MKSEAVMCEWSTSAATRDWLCLRKDRRTNRVSIEIRSTEADTYPRSDLERESPKKEISLVTQDAVAK